MFSPLEFLLHHHWCLHQQISSIICSILDTFCHQNYLRNGRVSVVLKENNIYKPTYWLYTNYCFLFKTPASFSIPLYVCVLIFYSVTPLYQMNLSWVKKIHQIDSLSSCDVLGHEAIHHLKLWFFTYSVSCMKFYHLFLFVGYDVSLTISLKLIT